MLTIFVCKTIHTLCDSLPQATAVAVKDGLIVEVGTLDSMAPRLAVEPYQIDHQFADKVMLPGFIDPHLHPFIGAILLSTHFITAFEWPMPWGHSPAIKGRDNYLDRLRELFDTNNADSALFVSWGYHQTWHGQVTRADLNQISASRPIVIWHRSFHELILNDTAINFLSLDREIIDNHPQIDADAGRFYENGALFAVEALKTYLFAPEWFDAGLQKLHAVLHAGGHTTVADMAWGAFDYEMEWAAYQRSVSQHNAPYQIMMVPKGLADQDFSLDPEANFKKVDNYLKRDSSYLYTDRHVKFFTDGAIFSELAQLQAPGYLDGHHGEWLTAPEQFMAYVRPFWHAGYRIHVHCTGDLGLELAIDTLDALQAEKPRFDHRFCIEHFAISNEDQIRRLHALGGVVSANVYYLHELGEAYWQHSIGHELASQMARLGSLVRQQVPFALHSDFTMAPAQPLTNAWVAINRHSESGATLGENEKIGIHQALRAITIDAAYVLGQEQRIGSIRAGKQADFTLLDEDPYLMPPSRIKDIGIHATVFKGSPRLIES